ncbi:chemosensory receptor A [Elysia marginata]|uniref:Chemosensory receptor A n=1 Tax=Elysia marginata TaxID=1093978 RepID=A0AAV4IWC5_9GAST|nr:chemosensory receptor A [Elysia marginata]
MWNFNLTRPFIENGTSPVVTQLVSLSLRNTFLTVNGGILLLLSVAGLPINILNMMAFRKLGFDISMNISLFALSAADFACACLYAALAVIMQDMSGLIDLSIDLNDVQFMLGIVIVCLSAYGSCVTALINLERCCCVIFPTKFKDYFTRKSTICLLTAMLAVQMGIIATCTGSSSFSVTKSPTSGGRSRLRLKTSRLGRIFFIELLFWGASVPFMLSFVGIVVSTIFLSTALNQRNRWLKSLPGSQIETIAKNQKLVGTVVAISATYIICFLPKVTVSFVDLFNPALNPMVTSKGNIAFVGVSFMRIFQAFSGMFNIFIYVKMNSKFRQYLKKLLCCSPE